MKAQLEQAMWVLDIVLNIKIILRTSYSMNLFISFF